MTRSEYNSNVETWSAKVYRFALWNCGDRMRSEDAVQEAFAKLWQNRDRVSVEKGPGYLLTVARSYLIDLIRHDTVANRVHAEMINEAETSYEDHDTSMSDQMVAALGRLPEMQRTIMQLRDVEGYSYKEIATMLNINENQVQVYLFRARTAMKKLLSV